MCIVECWSGGFSFLYILYVHVCFSGLWLGGLLHLSLISTLLKLVCYEHVFPCIHNSSVDGQVRRYDLRFGKLHIDTISSKQLYIELCK